MTRFRTNKKGNKYPITPKRGKGNYKPPSVEKGKFTKIHTYDGDTYYLLLDKDGKYHPRIKGDKYHYIGHAMTKEQALEELNDRLKASKQANKELAGRRYKVSNEGMKKGYWKIVDTRDGHTVRSGMQSKSASLEIARNMNEEQKPKKDKYQQFKERMKTKEGRREYQKKLQKGDSWMEGKYT